MAADASPSGTEPTCRAHGIGYFRALVEKLTDTIPKPSVVGRRRGKAPTPQAPEGAVRPPRFPATLESAPPCASTQAAPAAAAERSEAAEPTSLATEQPDPKLDPRRTADASTRPDLGSDFFKELLDGVSEGVYFVDRERRITYWNHAAELITGYTSAEVVGRRCHQNLLGHVDQCGKPLCIQGCPLSATVADGAAHQVDMFLRHKAGHRMPVSVRAAPIRDRAGAIVGAVETFHDNSAQLAAADHMGHLRTLALLDPLTGVGNRRFTEQVIEQRLSELDRYGWPTSVLFIDIDHFKSINDTRGHETGDRVIRMVAQTLHGAVRTHDMVGRWGGDEFVAVLGCADATVAATVAERARRLVGQSMLSDGSPSITVTVSIGVATTRVGDRIEDLVGRADTHMYASRQADRKRAAT